MRIERFLSHRVLPSALWSGNGTNFIASEKELLQDIRKWNQRVLVDSKVKQYILCKLNPPSSSHYRRSWESFMRSSKPGFCAINGNRRPADEIPNTTFCLAEESLKARLLITANSDSTDLEALTPNNFLLESPSSSSPPHFPKTFDHQKLFVCAHAYSVASWSKLLKEYIPT